MQQDLDAVFPGTETVRMNSLSLCGFIELFFKVITIY